MSPVKELMEAMRKAKERKAKGPARKKVYSIASVADFKEYEPRILERLIHSGLTYFNLTVADEDGFSSCYFTPAAPLKKGGGTIRVDDYEKIVKLLLSHPKVRHIEYDPEGPCISAIFEDPYGPAETEGEEF